MKHVDRLNESRFLKMGFILIICLCICGCLPEEPTLLYATASTNEAGQEEVYLAWQDNGGRGFAFRVQNATSDQGPWRAIAGVERENKGVIVPAQSGDYYKVELWEVANNQVYIAESNVVQVAQAPLVTTEPVVAGIESIPIEIKGSGFGEAGYGKSVVVHSSSGTVEYLATDQAVELWSDSEIKINLDLGTGSGTIDVKIFNQSISDIQFEMFRYEWHDMLVDGVQAAPPLAITVDESSRVWVNQEFHRHKFQMFDQSTSQMNMIPVPEPAGPGIFGSLFNPDIQTHGSSLGEQIVVDSDGYVWFTQGGGSIYTGNMENHSRIVRVDPNNPTPENSRVYNIPGDQNEVMGLAWDESRGLMWATQAGLNAVAGGGGTGAALISFNPETTEWDNDFDFTSSIDHLITDDSMNNSGFEFHWLGNGNEQTAPANLVIDEYGGIWVTLFWGNSILHYVPETGEMREIPLADSISGKFPNWFGGNPWEIELDGQGHVVFTEFVDLTVGRIAIADAQNDECLSLNAEGLNPCVEEISVLPGYDFSEGFGLHSLMHDLHGNLWFTPTAGKIVAEEDNDLSVGFITPSWQHVVMLPTLARFPAISSPHSAGIAVDPNTGDIWFTEYTRKRIAKLQRLQ